MKKSCSIIRDLLPNYIENLVSEDTKQYVDNHIIKCEECKQILKDMEGDNIDELTTTLEKEAEAGIVKIIKRQKRIKFILKVMAIVFAFVLLVSFVCFNIRFIPINSVRSKAYKKLQELKQMDNYKLTIEKTSNVLDGINEIETTTYYYRYGNTKVEIKGDITMKYKNGEYLEDGIKQEGENKILYYSDGISNVLTIDNKTRNIMTSKTASNIEKGEIFEEIYPSLTDYSEDLSSKILMTKVFDLREDTYNNQKYYVLTQDYKELKTVHEYWINKETLLIDRAFFKQENPSYAEEQYKYNTTDVKYRIEQNVVTNEDVIIAYDDLTSTQYNIIN